MRSTAVHSTTKRYPIMYGIVNKAIQGLVTENYGEETWNQIKEISGVQTDLFLSNEPYPDETTYQLAGAASKVLQTPVEDILVAFGEYWLLKTAMRSYGPLVTAGGSSLKEFLINLPSFHNRVMLIYPELQPPQFKVTHLEENSLHLHYYSDRPSLQHFLVGLLQGMGKMFDTVITIEQIESRDEGSDHEVFKVSW